MRLQPGEGCRYTGGGSPSANVVLSVQHDGAICREGGPAKQEIGGITINMDNLRLCVSGGFERDDAFQSEIVASANADGSWTFYESRQSASLASATATPAPTGTRTPEPTVDDGVCRVGLQLNSSDQCSYEDFTIRIREDGAAVLDGNIGGIRMGNTVMNAQSINLNLFSATKSGSTWTIESLPGTSNAGSSAFTSTPTPTLTPVSTPTTEPTTADGISRRQFEASTPPGYVQVTLNDRGTVWGVPDRFTTDSSLGDVAYMLLGRLKGCGFANEELDRASIVYVKGDRLGRLSNYESAEVCRKTSSTWETGWDGVRITHLRLFDESSPTNVREFVYDESRGEYVEKPSGSN